MDIHELIVSTDIVDFISQYVELEEKGDEYWGISPFTDPPEKTPSFSVRRETKQFYDFSSGKSGGVLNFIQAYFNCSRHKAVDILMEYAGLNEGLTPERQKMSATKICQKYASVKHTEKPSKSQILPDDYMKRYEKRGDKLDVWRREGISDESLDRFQVFYDGFSNRLVYPIRNPSGMIVNIGGRTLDPAWKEKGLRKYTYFYSWGSMQTIYGLAENRDAILSKKEIILFEGCKSVLLADTWGIKNCGAILTSHLNQYQMKILAKLGVRVVFALDKEIKVWEDKQICKLCKYVNVEYVRDAENVLSEKDAPVDKGKDVFLRLYNSRKRLR